MRSSVCLSLVVLLAAGSADAGDKKKKKKTEEPAGSAPGLVPDKPKEAAKGELVPFIVSCATPGANIFVDGDMIGISPMDLPVPVAKGDHSIKVTRLGFAPFIDVFSTKGKGEVKLDIELVPVSGVVHVKSNVPGARVLLDGKYVGDAPLDVEADVGPRAVQVSKGCYKDFFENVMSVAGQESTLDVKLEDLPDAINPCRPPPPEAPKWYKKKWVWPVVAVGALAVGGAVVGTVFALQPFDLRSKAESGWCYDVMGGDGGFGMNVTCK